jgi:O-antigen/teichoic acid export membrane protein
MVRNMAINFSGLVLPTFVSLVTVPAYIHLVGIERYGVVSLVWTLIGYFGILDLGMGMAAQHQISKAHAANDLAQRSRVFWSAIWLNLATGILGGLIIYFGAFAYTAYVAHSSPQMQHEVYFALPWLAIAIPIANVSWVLAGAINGVERFGIYNTNQTIGTFLFQLLPLAAAWKISPTLQSVLAAAVVARLLAAMMLVRASFKVLDIKRIEWPQPGVAGGLFKFGGWMLVATMTSMITDTLDRILLGANLGARFVTYYTVPQNLVTRLNMLPNALVRTLFPRLSALERTHADAMVQQSLEFLNGIFTPVALFAMLVLAPFLQVWVGHGIAVMSAPVGRILVVGIWLVGQAGVMRIMIQSQIHPGTAARVGVVQLPFFVAALWFGVTRYGPIGAATVVVCRSLVDYGLLLWISRVRARPIALDMLAHLAFLIVGLGVAASIDAFSYPWQAIAAAVVLASINLAASIMTRPALRVIAQSVVHELSRRLKGRMKGRISLRFKARRDA